MTVEVGSGADLTSLFKSCVKTIRTRNKAMGVTLPPSKIFPTASTTPFSQFFSRSRDIQSNISNHRNLLRDHRKKYLQSEEQSMTDYERNYMEKVVSTNLRIIDDNIRTLENEMKSSMEGSKDAIDCQQNIIAILKLNFQKINSSFKEMKETRKKKQKEKDSLFRLQRPTGSKKRVTSGSDDTQKIPQIKKDSSQDTTDGPHAGSPSDGSSQHSRQHHEDQDLDEGRKETGEAKRETTSMATPEPSRQSTAVMDEEVERILGDLSTEERQMLEEENAHLYRELMSNQEEVRQITRQVVELGQMQDMLTENVDIQAHQIEEIQETIMGATENVREGNEQVREAMRKDAGFRVWIMFFLIVMSCTILFLDWYNS